MDEEDAATFKNVTESLVQAKKAKLHADREIEKKLTLHKQQQEEAELQARLLKEQQMNPKFQR